MTDLLPARLTKLLATIPEDWILWGSVVSVSMLVIGMIATPLLIVRIPADYFQNERRPASRHPLGRLAANLAGLVLIAAGLLMLILPGQGLLTIFIGLMIMDFPGKHRLERALVGRPAMRRALNWLRKKYGKEPLL